MTDFELAMKKVADALHTAAKKSGEIIENTRISYNIGTEKEKITKLQAKIGAKFTKIYKHGGDVPEFILADLREIAAIEETISALEKTIADTKPHKYCPECGAKLDLTDVYCAKCGAKQRPADSDKRGCDAKDGADDCAEDCDNCECDCRDDCDGSKDACDTDCGCGRDDTQPADKP